MFISSRGNGCRTGGKSCYVSSFFIYIFHVVMMIISFRHPVPLKSREREREREAAAETVEIKSSDVSFFLFTFFM